MIFMQKDARVSGADSPVLGTKIKICFIIIQQDVTSSLKYIIPVN